MSAPAAWLGCDPDWPSFQVSVDAGEHMDKRSAVSVSCWQACAGGEASSVDLTPTDARAMARALVEHADAVERGDS